MMQVVTQNCSVTYINQGACVCAAAVPAKRYRKRMQQQIGMCIQDITAPLLQRCSQLAAAGQDTDKHTNDILEDAHSFVSQLADIYDYVSPCFPEKYGIFRVIWQQYHEHLAFMLDCVGACAEQLANADILKVQKKLTIFMI